MLFWISALTGIGGYASPLVARDVEVRAQCPPHIPRVHAVLDGLRAGPPAQARQHVIDQDRWPADRAELVSDELVEFGQPHAPKLRRQRQRLMAHPYRIGDARDALPCPSRGLPIPR